MTDINFVSESDKEFLEKASDKIGEKASKILESQGYLSGYELAKLCNEELGTNLYGDSKHGIILKKDCLEKEDYSMKGVNFADNELEMQAISDYSDSIKNYMESQMAIKEYAEAIERMKTSVENYKECAYGRIHKEV